MNAFLRPSQPWWQCNPYRSLHSSPPPCAIAESTKFVKLSSSSAYVLVSEVYRVSRSSSDRHNPPGRDGTGPDNWASIPKLDSRFDPPLSSSPEILYDEVLLVFLCSSLLARNSHSRRSCLLCLPSSALPPFLHLVPPPIHFGAAAAAAKWNKSGSFLFSIEGEAAIRSRVVWDSTKTKMQNYGSHFFPFLTARYTYCKWCYGPSSKSSCPPSRISCQVVVDLSCHIRGRRGRGEGVGDGIGGTQTEGEGRRRQASNNGAK